MLPLIGWVPGPMEMLIVGGVMFLLFGHRLPSMMRSLGAGVVEFKKGMQTGAEDPPPEGAKPPENKSQTP
jgi:sec-independent protein translocase protein TatA